MRFVSHKSVKNIDHYEIRSYVKNEYLYRIVWNDSWHQLHKRQLTTRTRVINRTTENAKSRGLMHSGWIKVFRNLRVRTFCFVISKLITSDLGHGRDCDNTQQESVYIVFIEQWCEIGISKESLADWLPASAKYGPDRQ